MVLLLLFVCVVMNAVDCAGVRLMCAIVLQAALASMESSTTQLRDENSRLRSRVEELSTHVSAITSRQAETDGVARLTSEQLDAARSAADEARRDAEERQGHMASVSPSRQSTPSPCAVCLLCRS